MELIEAVREDNIKKTRKLINSGADVNEVDENGFTALHYAVKSNNLRMVKALCEHGANVNTLSTLGLQKTPLYLAAESNYIDIAKFLVSKKGANINKYACSENWTKEMGQTPLHRAAYKGHLDMVQFLVDAGADITTTDEDGWTPLHCASYLGRQDVINFLVAQGANVNEKDSDGLTPLNCASHRGFLNTVTSLLKKGANVDGKDKDGMTPLHHAAKSGNMKVLTSLLESDASINSKDGIGDTALHLAARLGHLDAVTYLVRRGANVNKINSKGESPLHQATAKGHLNIVKFLLEEGAATIHGDSDGWTPLHMAASVGHLEVMEYLLRKGADIDALNSAGEIPVDCACGNEIERILTRFKENGFLSENADDDIGGDAIGIDESGGSPSQEELVDVAQSITGLTVFWCLFQELGIKDGTIANVFEISATQSLARTALDRWLQGTSQSTDSERRKVMKTVKEFYLIKSTKGMTVRAICGEIANRIDSMSRLIALCSELDVEVLETVKEIEKGPSAPSKHLLQERALLLLRQWVQDGGKRVDLLRVLQAIHITEAAESVSNAIHEQPGLEDSFSHTTVGDEGGEVQLGEGDVKMEVPAGALPNDSTEVVTIRVPTQVPDMPDEEGDVQVSPPVLCTPSGLKFKKPVKIKVPHCTSLEEITQDTRVILCVNERKGKFSRQELPASEYAISADSVEISVQHFSTFRVIFKNLFGLKVGFISLFPEFMPKKRKPIMHVYVYQMYKRNEQKLLTKLKQKGRSIFAHETGECLPKSSKGELVVACIDRETDHKQEYKITFEKLMKKKSNTVDFELDFSNEVTGNKNFTLTLSQGDDILEQRIVEAQLKEPKGQSADAISRNEVIDEIQPKNDFEKKLYRVAENIPNDKLDLLGLTLEYSMAQVKRYEQTNMRFTEVTFHGTFKMLLHWVDKSDLSDTRKISVKLKDALIEAELLGVAEEFFPGLGDIDQEIMEEDELVAITTAEEEDNDDLDVRKNRARYNRSQSEASEVMNRPWWVCCASLFDDRFEGDYSLSKAKKKKDRRSGRSFKKTHSYHNDPE